MPVVVFVSCSPPLPAELAVQSSRPDGPMLLAGPYDLADPILAERLLQLPDVDDVDEDGDTEELITLDPDPGTAQVEMLVENLLGCHPLATGCAGAVAEASPATDAHQPLLAGMPPTFIAHAENDDVVDPQQSLVMGYRLCLAGVEVHYEHMTTGGHALDDLSDDTVDQFLSAWNPATAPASPAPTTSSCNVP